MKKSIRSFIILSVLLSVMTVGGLCASHAADNDGGSGVAVTPAHGIFASIALTDDQKTQLKEVFQKYRPTVQPLSMQYVAERRQLRKLTHAMPVDDGAIRAQAAKVSAVGADLAVQRAHLIQDIRSVLTQEQVQKLSQADDDVASAKIDRFLSRFSRHGAKE
jgi:Spy/CpxP family protein refolding chaperone